MNVCKYSNRNISKTFNFTFFLSCFISSSFYPSPHSLILFSSFSLSFIYFFLASFFYILLFSLAPVFPLIYEEHQNWILQSKRNQSISPFLSHFLIESNISSHWESVATRKITEPIPSKVTKNLLYATNEATALLQCTPSQSNYQEEQKSRKKASSFFPLIVIGCLVISFL